ncbi:Conserved_hypothetical protein [Hexamita inflata]|uniref:4Fe-4S ferredoxin-type domain-containing protein n=1 Tax=Hexamita inflata TaxID=28002 RepID=A0AA86QI83_9EUKA|nr:Conserved hypothetical protein [Hexamita inflata]CAI9953957.1 Conserved hypothetical protein [Hexamita inflata]
MISSNELVCENKCPETEVFISGAAKCSTCTGQQVPNLGQTACVDKTQCSPGYLNLLGTKCITNCNLDKAGSGPDNQCGKCNIINVLSYFNDAISSCACAPNAKGTGTSCLCNTDSGFTNPDCTCPNKISIDGTLCSEKCIGAEVSINNAQRCTKCKQTEIPNPDHNACTDDCYMFLGTCYESCPKGSLKTHQKTCVTDCKVFDQLPNPTSCEVAGISPCMTVRKIPNGFVCTACESFEFQNGFECTTNCDGQFILSTNKKFCTSVCGIYPKAYAVEIFNQVSVNVCYDQCPPEAPDYSTEILLGTQKCFLGACDPAKKLLETNFKCVTYCASGMYFVNQSARIKYQCLQANATCNKYFISEGMKECYNACPLIYPFVNGNECQISCSPYMNDPKSPTHKICVQYCGGLNPPYAIVDEKKRTQCTQTCGSLFVQQVNSQLTCVSFCQTYTWDGFSKICTNQCKFYIIDQTKHLVAQLCGDSCAELNLTYSFVDQNGINNCVPSCTALNPFVDGTVCTKNCAFIVQQQITDISKYKCQASCPKFGIIYSLNESITICVQSCVGAAPYIFGNLCVSNCALTANKFVGTDSITCVASCTGEAAINTNGIKFCDLNCDFYINQDIKYCQTIGTIQRPYKQIYQSIEIDGVTKKRYQFVEKCENNEYGIVNGFQICQACKFYELVVDAHKCVSSCSIDQVQLGFRCFTGLCKDMDDLYLNIFTEIDKQCAQSCGKYFVLDQQSLQCSKTCPTNSVYKVDTGLQFCTFQCIGDDDYVTLDSRYIISGVGQCVQTCPIGSFKDPSLDSNSYKYCVASCQSKQYKVVNGDYLCVMVCPVYVIETLETKRCYETCADSAPNNIEVKISTSETQCVSTCPLTHPFMPANGDLKCVKTCPQNFYTIINGMRKCSDSCVSNTSIEKSFTVANHYMCRGECDDAQVFKRISNNIGACIYECPKELTVVGPRNAFLNQEEE